MLTLRNVTIVKVRLSYFLRVFPRNHTESISEGHISSLSLLRKIPNFTFVALNRLRQTSIFIKPIFIEKP
jgi:hypothetical protein